MSVITEERFEVIKNLISREYPHEKLGYTLLGNGEGVEVVINIESPKSGTITILPENNWTEIKRNIAKKLTDEWRSEDCPICFNTISRNVTCNKCSNNYCIECYINLFRHGRGVFKCPHCRYGDPKHSRFPEHMIESMVEQIRNH